MGLVAAVIGSTVVGAGVSLAGQSKQSSDLSAANAANTESVDRSNQANWNNWLTTRGLSTGGTAPTGSIPGVPAGTSVNTKLPLWANVTMTPGGGSTPRWVKKGTASGPSYSLTSSFGSAPSGNVTPSGGGGSMSDYGTRGGGGYSLNDAFLNNTREAIGLPWRVTGNN